MKYDLTYAPINTYIEIVIMQLGLQNDKTFHNKMMCLSELCMSKLIFYNFTTFELVLAFTLFLFKKNLSMIQKVKKHFKLENNFQKLEKISGCIYEIKMLLEFIKENENSFQSIRKKYSLESIGGFFDE